VLLRVALQTHLQSGIIAGADDLEGVGLGWRNGSFVGVLLVAFGAALWGTDAVLRVPLLEVMSPAAIVLSEHLVLLLYSVPAVVLGWGVLADLRASQWVALLIIAWGGSALATLLFTTAFVLGNPTVVILLQKTQPLFAIALAHVLLRERLRWAYWPCFAVAILGAYLISFDGLVEPFEALGSVQALPAFLTLGAAILWGSSTALGRFVLKDMPFHTLTGARLLLALPVLWVIVLVQGSLGELGAGFAAEPARVVLLALVPGLVALLLYYRGLSGTKASYATLAEISFPASAVILNWVFLGAGVSANQILGFALLWGAILALGYLNARDPAPAPPVGELGAGRTG
jgi:drug/metabolite transporter (DMT)-like permease